MFTFLTLSAALLILASVAMIVALVVARHRAYRREQREAKAQAAIETMLADALAQGDQPTLDRSLEGLAVDLRHSMVLNALQVTGDTAKAMLSATLDVPAIRIDLLRVLKRGAEEKRVEACELLAHATSEESRTALDKALHDRSWHVQLAAARALAHRTAAAPATMIERLSPTALRSARLVEIFRPFATTVDAIAHDPGHSAAVRTSALAAIQHDDQARARDLSVRLIQDDDPRIARTAARFLDEGASHGSTLVAEARAA